MATSDSTTQVSPQYDESGGVSYYYSMPTGTDSDGNTVYRQIPVSADQITTTYQSNFDPETGSSWQTPTYFVPTSAVNKEVDKYTPPPIDPNYKRPDAITQSGLFQDVNPFSGGTLQNIYDAINSGAYKVSPDKSQLISPYGTFGLTPVGNNLYDIYMPARSGSYRTTVGVSDTGKAVLNKDMLDKGAVRYVGGQSGGWLQNTLNDLGPAANIALAVALGPEAGFLMQAGSQTALNLAKGQDFQDAVTRGVISGGITSALGGGAGTDWTNSANWDTSGLDAMEAPFATTSPVSGAGDVVTTGLPPVTNTYNLSQPAGFDEVSGGLLTEPVGDTGIYPGEGVRSGIPEWDQAYTNAGGTFAPIDWTDPANWDTAGLAAAGMGGAAAAGLTAADLLKYAAMAGVASKVLGGNKTPSAGTGGGPDQTPVGAGLSPSYKPYRYQPYAAGGATSAGLSAAADHYNLGGYSDGGRLLRGPGDGVSDSIPATIGEKRQPARLADGEFVVPARIVSELGNGSTEAGARKLYAMMDRIQAARKNTVGKGKVAKNTRADKHLPA